MKDFYYFVLCEMFLVLALMLLEGTHVRSEDKDCDIHVFPRKIHVHHGSRSTDVDTVEQAIAWCRIRREVASVGDER